jgi:gliding motility-associated-like protein
MPAYAGSPIAFTDSSISGVSWLWDFGDNNGTSTLQNPSYTYLNSGEYPVTIMIQDNIGCADTSIQIVQVLSNNGSSENFIPNVFSPNGDQIHDVFGLTLQGIDLESFKIFDRWGHLVFETDNINDKWDGKGLNKQPCTEGAYYYILVGKDANQEKWVRKGYVTLIR